MIFNDLSTIDKVDSCGRWMHNDDSLKKNMVMTKLGG